jgi:GntR family transcriptional regulator
MTPSVPAQPRNEKTTITASPGHEPRSRAASARGRSRRCLAGSEAQASRQTFGRLTCSIKFVADAGTSFPAHRIVDDLRGEIVAGGLAPGGRLPSEHELALRYGTSRPTVRRAIARLKAEGLVVTEQGRGAFVRPEPHVRLLLTGASYRKHRGLGLPGFNAQALEQGQAPGQLLREVAVIGAPGEVALRLDVDEGAAVVVRRRLFVVNGQPVAFCDSYYPADLAAGTALAEPGKIRGGAHAAIEDPAGPIRRTVARSVDELVARMPTHEEASGLQIPPGVPVVRILRTVYDTEGRPLEVQDTLAAADRHAFRYEVAMTDERGPGRR